MEKEKFIAFIKTELDKKDGETFKRIKTLFYRENIVKLRWSAIFVFFCQILFIIRDFIVGFYKVNPLNYINLGIASSMAVLSLLYYHLTGSKNKSWDDDKKIRVLYFVYMVAVFITVCGYTFTDMYVRSSAFGVCLCFLFLPIIAPFFELSRQFILFAVSTVFIIVTYFISFPEDPFGVFGVIIVPLMICTTSCFLRTYFIKILVYKERTDALNEELTYRNKTDFLTDVNNRFCLYDDYNESLKTHKPIGIVLFDVDDFKKYNDSFSHLDGDKCLQNISKTVKTFALANNAKVYRYGGEEFVVIFFNAGKESFTKQVAKINKIVYGLQIKHADSALHDFVSVSIGATFAKNPPEFVETLLLKCDKALYEAKSGGKNRHVIAE